MTSLAQRERQQLADLSMQLGPDQPTLCEGWDIRDLLAHLVVRESRMDAAVGIVLPQLASYTDKVQNQAAKKPFTALVDAVRNGPPLLSPFKLPGVDNLANTMEFLVHHEDIRRAQPDWEPRELTVADRQEIFKQLKRNAGMLFKSVSVRVRLQPTDVPDVAPVDPPPGTVALRGPVMEIVMHAYGRQEYRDVEELGAISDVIAYREGRLGF